MELAHDVIVDLLPAYCSGEASAATRALVNDYLKVNPTFAEKVQRDYGSLVTPSLPSLPPDAALLTLNRAKRTLTQQRWLFGLAMAFTTLPLSMQLTITGGRIEHFHFLIRDYPQLLLPSLVAGATCWFAYWTLRRR